VIYRITHDPESGAFYVRLREGEYYETVPLGDPGLGAGVDVDADGNVLGLEFLSFEEFAEVLSDRGGALDIPERLATEGTPSQPAGSALMRWSTGGAGARAKTSRPGGEALRAALSSLSPEDQEILRLLYFEGRTSDETADLLGISRVSFRVRHRAALRRLRASLEERDSGTVDVAELEALLSQS